MPIGPRKERSEPGYTKIKMRDSCGRREGTQKPARLKYNNARKLTESR